MTDALNSISEICNHLKEKFEKIDFISVYTERNDFKVFENKIKDEINLKSLKFILTNTLTDGYNENDDMILDYGEKGSLACYQLNTGLWLIISANKKAFPLIHLEIGKIERANNLNDLEIKKRIDLHKDEEKPALKKSSKKSFKDIRMEQNMLPDLSILSKHFSSYFSYYKAADVLSSDLYWIKDTPESLFVALASCTNKETEDEVSVMKIHKLLNQRIEKNPLNSLKLIHKDLLNPNGIGTNDYSISTQLAICRYDKKTGNIQMATSGISVLYIENESYNLISVKPKDTGSIKIETINLNTNKNDKVILFSGGLENYLDNIGKKKLGKLGVKKMFMNMKGDFSKKEFKKVLAKLKGTSKLKNDISVLAFQI